ncbi:hypothetical protein ACJRO7_031691 [Eucalyptus globulus]|uniref:EF-hand domain-containing protein n=1 Tax=Eucalyptus globulus TaxID=34317 RepID=A0ABD3JH39_EUCGL
MMEMVVEAVEALPAELSKPVSADIDVEKVREAASAHFKDLTEDQKKAARRLFDTMDKDENGDISLDEFKTFLSDTGLQTVNPDDVFAELDKDASETLSFEELVTFFYVLSRNEYKDRWKRQPSTDVQGQEARSGHGMTRGAKDRGRRWKISDLSGLYDMFKGVYKLEEWVKEKSCTIV